MILAYHVPTGCTRNYIIVGTGAAVEVLGDFPARAVFLTTANSPHACGEFIEIELFPYYIPKICVTYG